MCWYYDIDSNNNIKNKNEAYYDLNHFIRSQDNNDFLLSYKSPFGAEPPQNHLPWQTDPLYFSSIMDFGSVNINFNKSWAGDYYQKPYFFILFNQAYMVGNGTPVSLPEPHYDKMWNAQSNIFSLPAGVITNEDFALL
jgi:hypothetical protein